MSTTTVKANRKKTMTIVIALIAVMIVGGVSAYFTSTDQADNTWTVGKVKIDLHEDQYDANNPEESKDMTPNEEIHKDPKIENIGKNDAYCFFKVTIPKANVIVANQDGTRQPSALQELFDYQWNEGWTVVSEDTTTSADHNTYILAYAKDGVCTAVAPENMTTVLFKNSAATHIDTPNTVGLITFKNVIEGQGLEEQTLEIDVKAFAIQTTDLGKDDVTSPAEVWNILYNQTNETTVDNMTDYYDFAG